MFTYLLSKSLVSCLFCFFPSTFMHACACTIFVVTHSQMVNSHTFLLFKSRVLKNKQQDQKVSVEAELLTSDL